MKKKIGSHKLNDKQRMLAQERLVIVQRVQRDFQVYMEGLMAGIGLNGDKKWQLNINTWAFEKVEKPKGDLDAGKE